MITAVDSNVLIDVFLADEQFGTSSAGALRQCISEGSVVISGIVLVETLPLFKSSDEFLRALSKLQIEPATLTMESYLLAASVFKTYRKQGGQRNRVVADFLIGAHASAECDRLLTRDRGFYRQYFRRLSVLQPK